MQPAIPPRRRAVAPRPVPARAKLGRAASIAGLVPGLLGACLASAADVPSGRIDVSLRTVDGRAVTTADLPPKWLIVYFGYAYCPDVCPTALVDLKDVLDRLGPLAERFQPVFITIDPERDTPDLLAQYTEGIDPRILPLTGSADAIRATARRFHVHYVRYQDPGLASYSIDHSSSFYVVDPDRALVADLPTPELEPAEIAASLREMLDRSRAAKPGKQGGWHDNQDQSP
jgi:protein SCO1